MLKEDVHASSDGIDFALVKFGKSDLADRAES